MSTPTNKPSTVTFCIPHAMFTPYTPDDIKAQLQDNPLLACQIVLAVWALGQTEDERANKTTTHLNGVGFSGSDAKFGTSLAEQIHAKTPAVAAKKQGEGGMSYRQMRGIFKLAHRYKGQAAAILNGEVSKPAPIKADMVQKAPTADKATPPPLPKQAAKKSPAKKKTRIRRKAEPTVVLGGEGGVVTVEKVAGLTPLADNPPVRSGVVIVKRAPGQPAW